MNFLKLIKNFLEHLTEKPSAPIVDEPTSEKTIMETDKIVDHICDWAKSRIDSLSGPENVYDQLALIDEYHEWFDLSNTGEEVEVITLDEITEEQYDDYTEYMNDGIERA